MYYVFAYEDYYASGGAKDLVFFNEDLFQCLQFASDAVRHGRGSWSPFTHADVYGQDDVEGLKLERSFTR